MRTLIREAGPAAVLALAALIPGTAQIGAEFGDLPVRPMDRYGVALAALMVVPLIARCRYPAWCLAAIGLAFAGYELAGYRSTVLTLGLYVALYSAGAHAERRRVPIAVAALAGYAGFAVGLAARGSADRPADYLLIGAVLAACAGVGAAVRDRRRDATDRQAREVAGATAAERARIARDLHDVVTHHVTAMVVQSDAAAVLLAGDPARAAAGLDAIAATGRRALGDLRELLDVLRADAAPPAIAPGGLHTLVEEVRAAGQPVELVLDGDPPGGGGLAELAAYRVVQEALTNALRHAPGRATTVLVIHREEEIMIEVDNASGPARGSRHRPGYGLVGLAERIELAGGTFAAGPCEDGGFRVTARIPRPVSP
jgi:signal transduction histidine kinase